MDQTRKSLHTSKSFTRLEPSPAQSPLARSRASTLQGPPVPEILFPQHMALSPEEEHGTGAGDVFATKEDDREEEDRVHELGVPDTFEELPIEIRSLTERFLESLSAKVHPSPLSAESLSDLFQDFYNRASSHITTHIATLASRLSRETSASPAKTPPTSSGSGRAGSLGSRKGSDDVGSEQQMLTASEIADRKKARRLLEVKRAALEEAVERAVCEKVYEKLWRHRSTDDEERDHKLRSRTAALSLVGIGLKELLMTAEELTEEEQQKTREREGEIREWLSTARADIQKMDDEKYPLGKLQHLTTAHKSIVEALSKIFPASSSADEILPTLIYTLITSPPETINVISNLKFIQRFRGSSRIDGETAYCLVNLEAAITFLETVDLSSLRAEESRSGPGRTGGGPTAPESKVTPMKLGLAEAPDLTQTVTADDGSLKQRPASPTTKAQRRLSNLIQAQTNRIEAAGDAVRESIIDSADQALDTIHSTLDNSFKFLFGRLKEQHPNSPVQAEPTLPKTLEDARKLVSSPHLGMDDDNSSLGEDHIDERGQKDNGSRMTDLFGGRRPIRDHSVDSAKSGGSNGSKRVSFLEGKPALSTKPESVASVQTSSGNAAVESMRNLGNTLNPLNRFANMNMIPRFGRSSPSTPVPAAPPELKKDLPPTPPSNPRSTPTADISTNKEREKEAKAMAALEALRKTAPPVKRFLELKDAKDLRVGEIEELLKEYQRLAVALRQAINT